MCFLQPTYESEWNFETTWFLILRLIWPCRILEQDQQCTFPPWATHVIVQFCSHRGVLHVFDYVLNIIKITQLFIFYAVQSLVWSWFCLMKQMPWPRMHNLLYVEVCLVLLFLSVRSFVHLWSLSLILFVSNAVIEKHTKSTRFALICNHVNKIIPALQSRCTRFRFAPLDATHIRERLQHVIKAEGYYFLPDFP